MTAYLSLHPSDKAQAGAALLGSSSGLCSVCRGEVLVELAHQLWHNGTQVLPKNARHSLEKRQHEREQSEICTAATKPNQQQLQQQLTVGNLAVHDNDIFV